MGLFAIIWVVLLIIWVVLGHFDIIWVVLLLFGSFWVVSLLFRYYLIYKNHNDFVNNYE